MLDRNVVEDERLSWAARGILAYLLAKPDDWQVSLSDLRKRGNLGRDGVHAIVRELVAHGYMRQRKVRDENGRFQRVRYTVHERPPQTDLPDTAKPDTAEPTTARPDTGEPAPAIPTLPINQCTNTEPLPIPNPTNCEKQMTTDPKIERWAQRLRERQAARRAIGNSGGEAKRGG